MFDEEIMKSYIKSCSEAHSNIEAPLLGEVICPICKSCIHASYEDSWGPKCAVYGNMPIEYMRGDNYECPEYKQIPNVKDSFLPQHMRKNRK